MLVKLVLAATRLADQASRVKDWVKDAARTRSVSHPLRSPHWPAKRRLYLLGHPCCAVCGQPDHAQVHHIVPFHIDPSKELLESNFITLCEEKSDGNHHLKIGHRGDWKDFNPGVVADAARMYAARKGSYS